MKKQDFVCDFSLQNKIMNFKVWLHFMVYLQLDIHLDFQVHLHSFRSVHIYSITPEQQICENKTPSYEGTLLILHKRAVLKMNLL